MIKVKAAASGDSADILIHEAIGADWFGDGMTSKKLAQDLAKLPTVKTLNVRINSPGGSVTDGVGIYNILRGHGAHVAVVVEGLAASIASIIAMAGDTIRMGEGALMMVHSPWTVAVGDAKDMRETADVLDKFESALLDIYQKRTGMDRAELQVMLDSDTWMDGMQAVALGFADSTDSADPADTAAAMLHRDYRDAYQAFASNFRKPADVTPLRIAAALKSAYADTSAKEPSTMDAKSGSADSNVDVSKVAAEAAAQAVQAAATAEADRRSAIRDAFTGFSDQHRPLLDVCLDDPKCSVDAARTRLLAKVAESQAGPLGGSSIVAGRDARDGYRVGAQSALLVRMGIGQRDPGNEYNGMSLAALAARALQMAGVSVLGMSNDQIARKVLAQHSSSDFPNLLSSTAGKVLRAAYDAYPQTWQAWASIGQVSDFKIHPRIQLGSFSSLATIVEGGEYTYGTVNEYYENAQAATKGKAISFTRQMLVNDDLGGFNRRAQFMGDSAARTVNNDVYAYLTSGAANNGPTSSDTGQFFNATVQTTAGGHANLTSSGTALSVASLGVGRVAMTRQKDPTLQQVLNIMPAALLVPVGKEDTARTLLASDTDPSSSNSKVPNIYKNRYAVVADPYLDGISATAWYLTAAAGSPAALLEVVFLDGNQTPFIDDEVDFDSDALKFKVRLDYGVCNGDWRGGYKNAGA